MHSTRCHALQLIYNSLCDISHSFCKYEAFYLLIEITCQINDGLFNQYQICFYLSVDSLNQGGKLESFERVCPTFAHRETRTHAGVNGNRPKLTTFARTSELRLKMCYSQRLVSCKLQESDWDNFSLGTSIIFTEQNHCSFPNSDQSPY